MNSVPLPKTAEPLGRDSLLLTTKSHMFLVLI